MESRAPIKERQTHTIIMYILIVLLAVALTYTALRVTSITSEPVAQGEWQCNQAVCSQFVNPQTWVAQFCSEAVGEDGEPLVTCTVNLEGVDTQIPLEFINLSFVAQQCEVVTCLQEINVRPVNYTVNISPEQLPQQ
jgi:hypothetical protein